MINKIDLSLFRSDAFSELPKSMQELGLRALNAALGTAEPIPNYRDADYAAIKAMVHECVRLVGRHVNGFGWLMILPLCIAKNREALNQRWPYPATLPNGSEKKRSIEGKLFASVAVWRFDIAMRAIGDNDHELAMNEVALSGLALHLSGAFTGVDAMALYQSQQRRMAASQAATASHATHSGNKQKAREWYAANKTMTKDAAAEKMAKDRVVHAAFRTIRGYLTGQ
jgi:hypothetical protein